MAKRCMIVDDEKALVALAEEMLAELGYEPIGFSSSVAALEAFREAPQRFDIVLTDETMPELIGTALAREIRLLRPDIPDRADERLRRRANARACARGRDSAKSCASRCRARISPSVSGASCPGRPGDRFEPR